MFPIAVKSDAVTSATWVQWCQASFAPSRWAASLRTVDPKAAVALSTDGGKTTAVTLTQAKPFWRADTVADTLWTKLVSGRGAALSTRANSWRGQGVEVHSRMMLSCPACSGKKVGQ